MGEQECLTSVVVYCNRLLRFTQSDAISVFCLIDIHFHISYKSHP